MSAIYCPFYSRYRTYHLKITDLAYKFSFIDIVSIVLFAGLCTWKNIQTTNIVHEGNPKHWSNLQCQVTIKTKSNTYRPNIRSAHRSSWRLAYNHVRPPSHWLTISSPHRSTQRWLSIYKPDFSKCTQVDCIHRGDTLAVRHPVPYKPSQRRHRHPSPTFALNLRKRHQFRRNHPQALYDLLRCGMVPPSTPYNCKSQQRCHPPGKMDYQLCKLFI